MTFMAGFFVAVMTDVSFVAFVGFVVVEKMFVRMSRRYFVVGGFHFRRLGLIFVVNVTVMIFVYLLVINECLINEWFHATNSRWRGHIR